MADYPVFKFLKAMNFFCEGLQNKKKLTIIDLDFKNSTD